MDSLTIYIKSSPLLYNAVLLSPLLILSLLITYVYSNRSYLRTGAGLEQTPPAAPPIVDLPPPLVEPPDPTAAGNRPPRAYVEDANDEADEEGDEWEAARMREFLREAGMDVDEALRQFAEENGEELEDDDEPVVAAGPADFPQNPDRDAVNPPPQAPRQRRTGPVGKKKARSLEQRDQRRAYYEFLRTQQRERVAEKKANEETEKLELREIQQRRALREEPILMKKREEIEERRAAEEFKALLRGYLLEKVPVGCKVDVGDLAADMSRHEVGKSLVKSSKRWFENLVEQEKLCGMVREDKSGEAYFSILTEDRRFFVKIGTKQVEDLLKELDKKNTMTLDQVGECLGDSIRSFGGRKDKDGESFGAYLTERQSG